MPDVPTVGAKKTCGIVRPIAALDGQSAEHWQEVHNIVADALTDSFDVKLVSDSDEVGVIQGRIVKNLYESDLVVCDVSGRNPNVMFELGMRLAFDKPTLVIKDEVTAYSFDSSPLEHIPYPRSLRFSPIINFKELLRVKAEATISAPEQPGYRSFLQHFGPIQVASFERENVPAQEIVLREIADLRSVITRLVNASNHGITSRLGNREGHTGSIGIPMEKFNQQQRRRIVEALRNLAGISDLSFDAGRGFVSFNHSHDAAGSAELNSMNGRIVADATREPSEQA